MPIKRLTIILFSLICGTALAAESSKTVVTGGSYEGYRVAATGSGHLYSIIVSYASSNATALMVFDSPTLPATGPVAGCGVTHTSGCVLACFQNDEKGSTTPTNATHSWGTVPLPYKFGLTVAANTNAVPCTNFTVDTSNEFYSIQISQ